MEKNRDIKTEYHEQTDFVRSVFSLSPEDISRDGQKKKRADRSRAIVKFTALALCAAVFAGAAKFVAESFIHYQKADNIYGGIGDIVMGQSSGNSLLPLISSPQNPMSPDYSACQELSDEDLGSIVKPKPVDAEFERIKNKLLSIKSVYPDLYGWIVLPGTPINYPIMQTTDNKYYLVHSYTGSYLKAGAIFADYRNSDDPLANQNLILYGHHLSNSSMFSSLDRYLNKDFFLNNNKIYIYTLEGKYTYSVISVYNTNADDPYITTSFTATGEGSFYEFGKMITEKSIFQRSDLAVHPADRILTLSTCSNREDDGRLAVHAVFETFSN